MKLTKAFEQAICVMALLATQVEGVPLTATAINNRIDGSHAYMRKVMRKLVVADLISSVPGNSGGFMLAKHPRDIKVLDVIEAVEGEVETFPKTTLLSKVFKEQQPVAIHGEAVLKNIFDNADDLWKNYLRSQTVMQIVLETFGDDKINHIDWNLVEKPEEKERHTLIGKVLKK